MALWIEKEIGPKADHLMRMQLAFDMMKARNHEAEIKSKKISTHFRTLQYYSKTLPPSNALTFPSPAP